MRIKLVATCVDGGCPATYATDSGTALVRGYVVTDPAVLAEVGVPDGEMVVEVPAELLARHVKGTAQ